MNLQTRDKPAKLSINQLIRRGVVAVARVAQGRRIRAGEIQRLAVGRVLERGIEVLRGVVHPARRREVVVHVLAIKMIVSA